MKKLTLLLLILILLFTGCTAPKKPSKNETESASSSVTQNTNATPKEDGVYTVENSTDTTTFAIFSDAHIGEEMRHVRTLKNVSAWVNTQENINYVLFLGDNIHYGYAANKTLTQSQLDLFNKYVPTLKKPYFVLRGNHDPDVMEFEDKMLIECGNTNVICFFADYFMTDPNDSLQNTGKVSPAMLKWIEEALKKSAGKRVIFACHYAIADKDGTNFTSPILPKTDENDFGREKLLKLAEQYDVELYFNGHEHNKNCPSATVGNITNFNIGKFTHVFAVVSVSADGAVIEIHNSDSPETVIKTTEYKFK
ncbi:MAG: metallophosphoesterase [Clostridia bacterium]|nr:metallophosphoesterase [Clostridia bacterium]